ncbi:putative repeat protein (TIGR01451 family) [Variovorax sp. TBS-050B]|uniref:DUF11 domain-containing protein n=1 Tax=Variovorax sp. TBS-050B TaxID=2940551 RepID=UPI00247693D1|nr:DUF11 domain-containing protein [Variovorax sp. TBS-050B]MDH6593483.1 putative repeat protein (TIGR01451 family) [Variovorax sp. TBS-050B]
MLPTSRTPRTPARARRGWLAARAASLALACLLGHAPGAAAAAPREGAVIRNVARATYVPPGNTQQPETVYSNPVDATVLPVEALSLTQDQAVSRPPNSTLALSHLLVNTGNTVSSYSFTLANDGAGCAADTMDLGALRLVRDVNGNGVVDGDESAVALGAPGAITLQPQEAAALLVQGTVGNVATGSACVALTATTARQGVSATNRDTVTVSRTAALRLRKSASFPPGPASGQRRVDFTISGSNIGAQDARPSDTVAPSATPLRVNGAPMALVLVRDPIPTGTQYISGTLSTTTPDAIRLFRLPNDPPFSYRTAEDASAIEVAIGFTRPVARNASVAMSFAVQELAGARAEIRNTAHTHYHDGAVDVTEPSNTVLVPGTRALIGVSKSASLPRANRNADNIPDGTANFRFTVYIQNYGPTTLYDVGATDVMEGAGEFEFGSYTRNAVPGPFQYTILPGTITITRPRSLPAGGVVAAVNPAFNGTAAASQLLAEGAVLPPGEQLVLAFDARINFTERPLALDNTVRVSAAQAPGGPVVASDVSIYSSNPDLNGDGDPTNDTGPTPVWAPVPYLRAEERVSSRRIAEGVYDLDYTISVTNYGTVRAPTVHVFNNLNCTFEMDRSDGRIASWEITTRPTAVNGLLTAAEDFTGRSPCDTSAYEDNGNSYHLQAEHRLSLVDGTRPLASGETETLTFTVRVTVKPEFVGQQIRLVNKVWAASYDDSVWEGRLEEPAAADHATVESLLLDPEGVVYDARTRLPVPGATVTFRRLSCESGPVTPVLAAELYRGDSGTYTYHADGSASMATNAEGRYEFILLSPPAAPGLCIYSLEVAPPAGSGYLSPSLLIPPQPSVFERCGPVVPHSAAPQADQPTTYHLRLVVGIRSDGQACEVTHNHIPLDPADLTGLVLRKDGSKRQVEFGDFLDYALTLTNRTGVRLAGVRFDDALPPGFAYVAGSARLNGAPAADPTGGAGPALGFGFPTLALGPGESAMVRYRVRIGVGAPTNGSAVNRARASAGRAQSNLAQWTVRVTGGVFSDEAYAFGKVYMDCRRDGRQQGVDEIGVPGVRLYMEDGTHVVTDVEGKWSLYGLKPVTHVLRLDQTTLPRGARLEVLDNRNAGTPESRFLDLKKGEFHKANFVIGNCGDKAVLAEVAARRTAMAARPDAEADAQVRLRLDPQGKVAPPGDLRSLPAAGQALASGSAGTVQNAAAPLIALPAPRADTSSYVNGAAGTLGGTIGNRSDAPLATAAPAGSLFAAPRTPVAGAASAPPPRPAAPPVELEALLPQLENNALAFIEPKDGETAPGRSINVRVKGDADASFRLAVNGTAIDGRRVGKKTRLVSRKIAAWEFIGVPLRPGRNLLRLEAVDAFGNVRGEAVEIAVVAPDRLGAIEIGLPAAAQADLRTPVPVTVRLVDAAGVPVTARTQLTLQSDRGRWLSEDLNATEPGTQVFMEGGSAEFQLLPPGEAGDARIRIAAGDVVNEARLTLLPEQRPMIGLGIVEGVLDFTRRGKVPIGAAPAGAAFESELRSLQGDGSSDGRRAGGRAAFFLKGTVKGEYLLTAAFDSDKSQKERLFRDIRPDEFYPIYGDSSVKGFDAQSTQKLFVRIDKNRSYLLYGDFSTASSSEVRNLSQSNRSLTGLKHVYESDRVRATTYASRTAQTQQTEEFRALGTSGPYYLSGATGEFVENSEQLEIVVRDRNQPGIVLQRTAMTRFVDYTLEPLTRRLLFTHAIASADANLNPQSIRVTYEVDAGGPKFAVAGVDVQAKVGEALQLGVVVGTDENPRNKRQLRALTGLARLGENTTVAAEVVATESDEKGKGKGARLEARYQDDKLAAVALATRTDDGFDNPGASFAAGRTEAAARAEYKLDPGLSVRAEALYGKDAAQADERRGASVSAQKKLGETSAVEVGVRHGRGGNLTGSNPGFDYGQISTYDGRLGSSIGANSVTALGADAAAGSVDPRSQTTVRARFSTQMPGVPNAQVFVEGEQDVADGDRRVLAIGGNYAITDKTRAYGRYELISSLYGPYALDDGRRNNVGIVGLESAYMEGGRAYNEYRLSDGADGRGVQAAIGVRNTVKLTERLRVTGGVEHTRDLSGYSNSVNTGTGYAGGLGESTALTSGIEYFTDRVKTSGVLEARRGEDANTRLFAAGFAYKLSPSWSLLARSIASSSEGQGQNAGNERHLQRHQVGVAYRPVDDDTWNALARYERRSEKVVGAGNAAGALQGGSVFGAHNGADLPGKTSADIVSAHLHYNPQPGRAVMGRYAGKISRFGDGTLASRYWAHLLQGRYTHDIDRDWDMSVQAGMLFGKGGGLQKSFGIEVGYQLYRNTWLSVGYNFVGLHDRDLTANEYTSKGAFIRLRFKFDETNLGFAPTAEAP